MKSIESSPTDMFAVAREPNVRPLEQRRYEPPRLTKVGRLLAVTAEKSISGIV